MLHINMILQVPFVAEFLGALFATMWSISIMNCFFVSFTITWLVEHLKANSTSKFTSECYTLQCCAIITNSFNIIVVVRCHKLSAIFAAAMEDFVQGLMVFKVVLTVTAIYKYVSMLDHELD